MLERKLSNEASSGSVDRVKVDGEILNNLFDDTKAKDELVGKLELGPTLLDITKGLKLVTHKKMT